MAGIPNVPWYLPLLTDGEVTSYQGPFADEAARDAYGGAYDGPDALGQPIQAVTDPNANFPQTTAKVATQDGEKIHWTDGNVTDA